MAYVQPGTLRKTVEHNSHVFKLEEEVTEVGRQWYIKLQDQAREINCAACNFVRLPLPVHFHSTSADDFHTGFFDIREASTPNPCNVVISQRPASQMNTSGCRGTMEQTASPLTGKRKSHPKLPPPASRKH